MKLKIILILSSLSLIITCALMERYIASQQYNACDIIEVNDLYKDIENDLKTRPVPEIEERYDCRIILRSKDNYTNELYHAIRNSDVILDYMDDDKLIGKIIFPANSNTFLELKKKLSVSIAIFFLVLLLIIYSVTFCLYRWVIHPFQRLKYFASNISVGDLEIPLTMDRANYFGAFTESFDMMRDELKRARQGEYEANRSKKELVAELSHDIKTPVATIKALCELLEVKVKDADTIAKLQTILQKADVIDKLISNMFHATLEELEVLKIEPREELSTIIPPMFEDLNHYNKIHIRNELPGCLIYCDKLRLNQVLDNIIHNSYKYADTDIDITYHENSNSIEIEIRDYGSRDIGDDLPLVFEKFYRGKNTSSHSGSGLGLYLAKQFMEGMEGGIECRSEQGFIVKLTIKKI